MSAPRRTAAAARAGAWSEHGWALDFRATAAIVGAVLAASFLFG